MKRELKKLDLNIQSYLLNNGEDQHSQNREKCPSQFVQAWERQSQSIKKDIDVNTPMRQHQYINLELDRSQPGLGMNSSEEKSGASQQSVQIDQWVSFIIKSHKKNISKPFFFEEAEEESSKGLGKLLCFNLTNKNKVFVKYSSSSLTCKPVYQCYGCNIIFKSPSALGGHLSRCPSKKHHFKMIHRLRRSLPLQDQFSITRDTLRSSQQKQNKPRKLEYKEVTLKSKYNVLKQQQISEEQE